MAAGRRGLVLRRRARRVLSVQARRRGDCRRKGGNRPRRGRHHEQPGRDRGGRAKPAEPASAIGIGPEPLDDSIERRREPAAMGEHAAPPRPVLARRGDGPPADLAASRPRGLLGGDPGADLVESVGTWLKRIDRHVQRGSQRAFVCVLMRVNATIAHASRSRTERSAAIAREVWLFTAPRVIPMIKAI